VVAHFTLAVPAEAAGLPETTDLRDGVARAVTAAELNPAPRPYRPNRAARP
jgi:hypothetical protein